MRLGMQEIVAKDCAQKDFLSRQVVDLEGLVQELKGSVAQLQQEASASLLRDAALKSRLERQDCDLCDWKDIAHKSKVGLPPC